MSCATANVLSDTAKLTPDPTDGNYLEDNQPIQTDEYYPESQPFNNSDEDSVENLIEVLNDEDDRLRINAALKLGKIGDERAVEYLSQIIWDDESEGHVRSSATLALGGIKDETAVEILFKALDNQDTGIKKSAVIALSEAEDVRVVEPFTKILNGNDKELREITFVALRHRQ